MEHWPSRHSKWQLGKAINLIISSPITNNQIIHMKYKTLLLLVLTLILSQSIYGQWLEAYHMGGSGGGNTSQWSEDMRLTMGGDFVEGSFLGLLPIYGPTLNAAINWQGNVPWPDGGVQSIAGSYNVALGVNIGPVSVGGDVGGNGSYSLKMLDLGGGCAALFLEYTGTVGAAGKVAGTFDLFLGKVYKDYPDCLFDKNDNLIDRKTKEKILDPTTGKPITKDQLDAERKAAADATKLNNFLSNYGVSADSFLPGDSLFGGDGPPVPIYTGVPGGVTLGDATVYNEDGSIAGYWVVGKSGKWWWLDPNKYKKYQELKDSLKKQNSE